MYIILTISIIIYTRVVLRLFAYKSFFNSILGYSQISYHFTECKRWVQHRIVHHILLLFF